MPPDTGIGHDPDTDDGGLSALDLSGDEPGEDTDSDDADIARSADDSGDDDRLGDSSGRRRLGPILATVGILAVVALTVWIGVGQLRPSWSRSGGPTDAPAFGNDPYFGTSAYVWADTVHHCSDDIAASTQVQRVYYDRAGRIRPVGGGAPRTVRVVALGLTPDVLTAMAASPAALQTWLTAAIGTTPAGATDPESRRLTVLEQVLSMPVLPHVRTNALAVLRALPRTIVSTGVRDRYGVLGTRLVIPTAGGGKFVVQYNPRTLLLQSADDSIAVNHSIVATCARRIVDVGPSDTNPGG